MDFKGWGDLDTRQWWLAVLVIAGPLLIGAGSTGHVTTAMIAAGATVWAVGEWVQHPYQQFKKDGFVGNYYNRVWSVFGVGLNIVGIALVAFAIYRFDRLGGCFEFSKAASNGRLLFNQRCVDLLQLVWRCVHASAQQLVSTPSDPFDQTVLNHVGERGGNR
jgi:hypothetical protein